MKDGNTALFPNFGNSKNVANERQIMRNHVNCGDDDEVFVDDPSPRVTIGWIANSAEEACFCAAREICDRRTSSGLKNRAICSEY